MTNRGRANSTRNKSRGRPYNRGPRGAASNANHTSLPGEFSPSPPRDVHIPVNKNNDVTDDSRLSGTSSSLKASTVVQNELSINSNNDHSLSASVSPSVSPGVDPPDLEVGDNNNKTTPVTTDQLPPAKDGESPSDLCIQMVLSELREIKQQVSELKEIKQQMSKLDKIESVTESLEGKLTGVMDRTSEIETAVLTNTARIREYDDQFTTLKASVDKHEKSMSSLNSIKAEFSKVKGKAVAEINELVSVQRGQVESFNSTAKKLSKNIMTEVDQKLSKVQNANAESLKEASQEISDNIMAAVDQKLANIARQSDFQALKDQAFNCRNNLVVVGLEEDTNKETSAIIRDFFVNSLKLKGVKFGTAYRIGSTPSSTSYARPILVHFPLLPQRNRVWRKRSSAQEGTDTQRVRVYADLPKQLRDDIQGMYKVARAANKSGNYHSVRVRDYSLELDDQVFLPSELEMLPFDIRPSTLSTPRSDSTLAFYSKYTVLSNHHPSVFYVKGQKFHTMEQFLAYNRAKLSGQESFIQKASEATDPVQAKYILTALREDNVQRWEEIVESVALEGLEAKFRQNIPMKVFLCQTGERTLGEASTNPRWGVGMSIDDKDILDVSKWNDAGNLLGRSLMKIRSIFLNEANTGTNA